MGGLDYNTTEDKLAKVFDVFGVVNSVRIVRDINTSKSKGYAFVEFKNEHDAEEAIWRGDKRIDGRLCLVDREFGRTKKDWKPKRFGGGKGDSRRDKEDEYTIHQIKKRLLKEDR